MIRYASCDDMHALSELDRNISETELHSSIDMRHVTVSEENGKIVGRLRYGLFRNNTPFINMLYVIDGKRGKGLGSELCAFWESEMQTLGYKLINRTSADSFSTESAGIGTAAR